MPLAALFLLVYDRILTALQVPALPANFGGGPTFADLPFAMRMLSARYIAGHYKLAGMYLHFRWVLGKSDHPFRSGALHLGARGGLRSAGASHTTFGRRPERARRLIPASSCDFVKPVRPAT